nr:tryptophan 7-halogenase [Acidimicrobiia bacterium]
AEAGAVCRELGLGDRMIAAGHPIKHGVAVYGPRGNKDWFLPVQQRTEDLVMHDQVTWQVRRSVFDTMMLEEAVTRGAGLLQGRAVSPLVDDSSGAVRGAQVRTDDGSTIDIAAELTVDCSGQATFLANQKVTGPKYVGSYDKQIAVFSQVANFVRDDGEARADQPGNTLIFYKKKYHWAWAIPIDDEVTSIGVVIPAQYFREAKQSKEDFVRREMVELSSALTDRIPEPELVEPAHVIPNYSFQVRDWGGPGFLCVGDSHRFVDPIFSFGLFVSMKEACFAADAIASYLDGKGRRLPDDPNPFGEHIINVEKGIDMFEDMIDTFWENPIAFAVFAHDRYREQMIDILAGRVFEGMPHGGRERALAACRKLLQRERSYDDAETVSVPIGSRFDPSRAPLWNSELDSVETTERWMREGDLAEQ